ncbi:hypothetical protein DLM78_19565 [Leptospira stimsonii]|uniref:Uncharacterized protein n=1 Tax=Leptospira stimsonii TaxID=2202203 RepID=A0A8B3CM55_9LEPT|nr:hypothetical protein DLM78_19565 [Leptospira stimsonii]
MSSSIRLGTKISKKNPTLSNRTRLGAPLRKRNRISKNQSEKLRVRLLRAPLRSGLSDHALRILRAGIVRVPPRFYRSRLVCWSSRKEEKVPWKIGGVPTFGRIAEKKQLPSKKCEILHSKMRIYVSGIRKKVRF